MGVRLASIHQSLNLPQTVSIRVPVQQPLVNDARILQQLDVTMDNYNKLQMDFDSLRSANGKLLQNLDHLKHENDANKKK